MKRIAILCFAVMLLAAAGYAAEEHPMSMDKTGCVTCHSDEEIVSNPEVVKEWNQSIHSYAGVACGNCHGDEKNFQAKPSKSTCETCHSEQVAVTRSPLACESCHIAHTVNVHRRMR